MLLMPTIDQKIDKMVSQLKSLRLSKMELIVAVWPMLFLNQIWMDLKKFITLLN